MKLNKYELFVANWFFATFPSNLSFEELKDKASKEVISKGAYDNDFIIWCIHEQDECIAENMQYMLDMLLDLVENDS